MWKRSTKGNRRSASLSDGLRRAHAGLWEAMVGHPFVQELGSGTLPLEKFQRYFLQDYLFVRHLTRFVALLVTKAPDVDAARRLTRFLAGVLEGEEELFHSTLQEWRTSDKTGSHPEALPTTQAFSSYLVRLGYEGTWAGGLTALCVTEWTYLDWATRLVQAGKMPDSAAYRQWIEIHTTPEFADFVGWLRRRLDSDAHAETRKRTAAIFRQCLRYEYLFWEMAYHGEVWPVPAGAKRP